MELKPPTGGTTDPRLHLYGIRHHGPGSARSLLAALDAADPAIVLIEGPPDADAMIPFAASIDMVPPIALLVHDEADASQSSFYPFAVYSPEWQAMRWALARSRPVRFIDLPTANQLAVRAAANAVLEAEEKAASENPPSDAVDPGAGSDANDEPDPVERVAPETETEADTLTTKALSARRDPLGYLSEIAGYEDGEAWWNALVEQGANAPTIFAAIESAMGELRAHADANPTMTEAETLRENQREAHMRLAIAAALKETAGSVAVVCGAWHVPALRRTVALADDKALLKSLPKTKVIATWVPWTDTRLAVASGYGAGVVSPGWYTHLWTEFQRPGADLSSRVFTARWQTRVAGLLRTSGRSASTASVIEAARLAETLAALRELALPGLDEMREATLATLCHGEAAPWRLIETELVIGRTVGEIDDAVPQMPLAADLARQQKKLKMKPEALDRDLSLDLRTEAGLAKSLLLHQLLLIKVPWGTLQSAGSSRGTFRENWKLRWDPEFSVRLAEALVHGTTVEQASGNAAVAAARAATSLAAISEAIKGCLLAGLDQAARLTIALLQAQATVTSDIGSLAQAIPPLVTILRYGTAREMPEAELRLLVVSLAESVSAGLVYGCRNLQRDEAESLRTALTALNHALPMVESEPVTREWQRALAAVANDEASHPVLRGFSVRALYEAGALNVEEAGNYLSRALSKSVPPLDAGNWLDGFLGQSSNVLVHDHALLSSIDQWLARLDKEVFTQQLPMLVRSFSTIDRIERRRVLDLIKTQATNVGDTSSVESGSENGDAPGFAAALPLLLTILGLKSHEAAP
jgi:Family of unknown function (DUF5682)